MLKEVYVFEKPKEIRNYEKIPLGSRMKFRKKRDPIVHYAVYIGNGEVIDFSRGKAGIGFSGPGVSRFHFLIVHVCFLQFALTCFLFVPTEGFTVFDQRTTRKRLRLHFIHRK